MIMKKISASLKKHIRLEKGRIRRDVSDLDQQNKLIAELTQKYSIEKPVAENI